jgi:hypothetical protein
MDNKNFKSIYKLYFFGWIIFTLFISFLLLILRPFGLSTVTFNGQELMGITAVIMPFIISIVISLLASLVLGFFAWVGYKVAACRK